MRILGALGDDRRPKSVVSGVEGTDEWVLVRTSLPPFAANGAQRMGQPKFSSGAY
jgi:hypothetical protein